MAMINIPDEELKDTYDVIRKAASGDVDEAITLLAQGLLPMAGSSEIVDQAIENGKALQANFNDNGFYDSLKNLLKDFEELDAVREYMAKKASVGSVSKVDTSFAAGNVDASAVIV